ncbi:hypothetical protein ACL6C3_30980 [Capilliphycus salinus ALCB114379]|uniref:hypothetical protein n=1 Tax=Capilliphycus salinus TaxID=2768948 RepID=UPI0039A41A38
MYQIWFFFIGTFLVSNIPYLSKFLTGVAVHSHIKSRLEQIKDGYSILYSRNPTEQDKTKDWINKSIEECKNLSSAIKFTSSQIINILRLLVFSAPIIAFINKNVWSNFLADHPFLDFIIVSFVLSLFGILFFPFVDKRFIFIGKDIYGLENNLFNQMSLTKKKEFSWDLLILALVSISILYSSFRINALLEYLEIPALFPQLNYTDIVFSVLINSPAFITLFVARKRR